MEKLTLVTDFTDIRIESGQALTKEILNQVRELIASVENLNKEPKQIPTQ